LGGRKKTNTEDGGWPMECQVSKKGKKFWGEKGKNKERPRRDKSVIEGKSLLGRGSGFRGKNKEKNKRERGNVHQGVIREPRKKKGTEKVLTSPKKKYNLDSCGEEGVLEGSQSEKKGRGGNGGRKCVQKKKPQEKAGIIQPLWG